MYVKRIVLSNIRSIEHLDWELDDSGSTPTGWHVIIGDNGSGKSGLLRAIALALAGPEEAIALRQDWNDWLQWGKDTGNIRLVLEDTSKWDTFSGKGRLPKNFYLSANLRLTRIPSDRSRVTLAAPRHQLDPWRHVWGSGKGWFSASYGPFRRFTGGDKDQEKLFYSNPKLARHLSVFSESVALTECLEWLKLLNYKQLEGDSEGDILPSLTRFVNQSGFLPHEARLHSITSKGVLFMDGNGCEVPVENLSDGYRSILSMTFELICQLAITYGSKIIFDNDARKVIAPGVVLIDEIDVHLHPTWQRRVGHWFRTHFPQIQFIVSTHSPLICQAATMGSIFRLRRPGSEDKPGMVTGRDRDRLLYGNVLDAYSTGVFGEITTRSPEALHQLARLAELNKKELTERLSTKERREQQQLRITLPTAASVMEDGDE